MCPSLLEFEAEGHIKKGRRKADRKNWRLELRNLLQVTYFQ
jgi:hypothetical protein